MKHWQIDQMDWAAFDATKVNPDILALVKAASVVERNARDYTCYLRNVFHDDSGFRDAAQNWSE